MTGSNGMCRSLQLGAVQYHLLTERIMQFDNCKASTAKQKLSKVKKYKKKKPMELLLLHLKHRKVSGYELPEGQTWNMNDLNYIEDLQELLALEKDIPKRNIKHYPSIFALIKIIEKNTTHLKHFPAFQEAKRSFEITYKADWF